MLLRRSSDQPKFQIPTIRNRIKAKAGKILRTIVFSTALPLLGLSSCCGVSAELRPETSDSPSSISIDSLYGHQTPEHIAKNAVEAHALARDIKKRAGVMMPPLEERLEKQIRAHTVNFERRVSEMNAGIAENWMTEGYLGPEIYRRYKRTPPIAIFIINQRPHGEYIIGTNVIGVNPYGAQYDFLSSCLFLEKTSRSLERFFGKMTGAGSGACKLVEISEADLRNVIAHEQLHYAAYLGGGKSIRWRDDNGNFFVLDQADVFIEGMTELHAQQLARANGHIPSEVNYTPMAAAGVYIQHLLDDLSGPEENGSDILRSAYLTGDFTVVREYIDNRLGTGTIRQLAGVEGPAPLACMEIDFLCELTNRMKIKGIDYQRWAKSDPILLDVKRDLEKTILAPGSFEVFDMYFSGCEPF